MSKSSFTGDVGERCADCMFFVAQRDPSDLKRSGSIGECRRFPPIAHPIVAHTDRGPQTMGIQSPWTIVKADLWCGEGRCASQ